MKKRRKLVEDKTKFLADVQRLTLNQLKANYKMGINTVYRNISWILGSEIRNLTTAGNFLKGKDTAELLKKKEE